MKRFWCSTLLAAIAGAGAWAAEEEALREAPVTEADREHWSFAPLVRPTPPRVQPSGGARNPIDAFVRRRLRAAGLSPQPPAGKRTLIRRATYSLTGLPPTPEEIEAFLTDTKPGAWERAIEGLLARSEYGERWAQHWLDLARFAETDGFEHDNIRKRAWQYRDWVIEALNRDLPYDEFVRLQIAGDLLRPDDSWAAMATGFAVAGGDMPDINLQEERRHMVLNDLAATVGSVFLALQMGCATCHDHKYDPISQADFYRLRAFFEPAIQPTRYKPLGDRLREPDSYTLASHVMIRGDFRRPGPKISPAFPRIANPWGATVEDDADAANSAANSRAALARWLSRDDHPLTARTIVNRVWAHHFGVGLVGTPSDFGLIGDSPTHPELLDWLATELVRRRWSLKSLSRLILSSATYRQASRTSEPGFSDAERRQAEAAWRRGKKLDPGNRLLWRMNRMRLEGEAIRDGMLAAAGSLSPRRGGPGVRPPLPEELTETLLRGQWEVSPDEADHRRRSVYLFVRRNLQYPLFAVFDKPDANLSCAQRSQSTIAPQALVLMNSQFSQARSRELAERAFDAVGADREAQVQFIWRRCLGRPPEAEELTAARDFLAHETRHLAEDGADPFSAAALSPLCLAVFNLNEFVYLD